LLDRQVCFIYKGLKTLYSSNTAKVGVKHQSINQSMQFVFRLLTKSPYSE